jgi:EmrB/QacA subfamily drug resistance transporter
VTVVPDPPASKHPGWLIVAMTLSVSIGFLDSTAVNVALPSIQRDFNISSSAAQWTVTAFFLAAAVTVAAGGRLADLLGRRRIYLVGMALFTISSIVCGLAPSDWWLIVGRALQGIAAGLLGPAAVALITVSYPPRSRGRALGTVGAAATIALAAGPLVGGFITQDLGWRWIFFVNVPLAIAAIGLVRIVATESRDESVHRVDLPGLVCLTAGLIGLVLALTQVPDWGLLTPATIGLLALGGTSLVLFWIIEGRVVDPLVHRGVLRHPAMIAASTAGFCTQFVIIAFTVFGIIYLQVIFGLSPLESGLAILPAIIPQAFIARRAGRLADAIGPTVPIIAGMGTMALALVWISLVAEHRSYPAMVPALVAFGVGIALVDTPTRVAAQSAVGERHQGLASGLTSSFGRLGGTLGAGVVGALIVALQYSRGLDLLAQNGIRVDSDDHAALESLIVNGKAGSQELREVHHVRQVEHAAHEAYTFAFANGMRLAAVVAAVAGIVAFALLRRRPDAFQ